MLVLISTLFAGSAAALETDQYYAWGRPLADSTDAVNAKFNLELERAIASFPDHRQPAMCSEVSAAFRSQMRFLLLHEIQVWAWNSEWVDRIPDGGAEQREYRRTNLYSNHPPIDTGTWMPFTPTIQVAGVRMGTDKLAHLVSSGWTYYSEYRKAIEDGETSEDAERVAVRRGLIEESLILGGMVSGVQSIADVEAGYGGLHFYRDLCDGDDPILKLDKEGWILSRPVDLRDYVAPRWDESFNHRSTTRAAGARSDQCSRDTANASKTPMCWPCAGATERAIVKRWWARWWPNGWSKGSWRIRPNSVSKPCVRRRICRSARRPEPAVFRNGWVLLLAGAI